MIDAINKLDGHVWAFGLVVFGAALVIFGHEKIGEDLIFGGCTAMSLPRIGSVPPAAAGEK